MMERELNWNDAIENDNGGFSILPAGQYFFTVDGFERKRHPGSAKLPPCNKAEISISVYDGKGNSGTVRNNLFLHTKTEGLLCQFFRAIGARKQGERLVMDWSKVVGASGICKITIRKYKKKDGTEDEVNDVQFLDPPEKNTPAPEQNDMMTSRSDDIPF